MWRKTYYGLIYPQLQGQKRLRCQVYGFGYLNLSTILLGIKNREKGYFCLSHIGNRYVGYGKKYPLYMGVSAATINRTNWRVFPISGSLSTVFGELSTGIVFKANFFPPARPPNVRGIFVTFLPWMHPSCRLTKFFTNNDWRIHNGNVDRFSWWSAC